MALLVACSSDPDPGPVAGDGQTVRPDGGSSPDYGATETRPPPPGRDSGDDLSRADSGGSESSCSAQGGGERAVVVAATNSQDSSQGTVALLTLNSNGFIADTQVRAGPIDIPRDIALRPDSNEAAISFGNSSADGSQKHGVALVSVSPDGSQASLVETKILEGNFGPLHISYTSNDSLIVSRIGPGPDDLLPLTRQPGGQLTAGTPFPVPNEFPQGVVAIPRDDHESLYLQTTLSGGSSTVQRISDAGGTITALGSPLSFEDRPMFIYMHPLVNAAYVPGSLPGSGTDPNPPGQLRVLTSDSVGDWAVTQPAFDLPELASLAAVAPSGEFIVFTDNIAGTQQWELYVVNLDSAGQPTAASAPFTYDASIAHDVAVSPEGHLVVSRRAKTSAPHDVIAFARTGPTSWKQCPESIAFDGKAVLEIAR